MGCVFYAAIAVILLTGLCCTGYLLYGYLLRPSTVCGTIAVVRGVDSGDGVEQRVRSLLWLQGCGLLRCSLVLLDDGLNEEGLALAGRLAVHYPGLTLCRRCELEHRLCET